MPTRLSSGDSRADAQVVTMVVLFLCLKVFFLGRQIDFYHKLHNESVDRLSKHEDEMRRIELNRLRAELRHEINMAKHEMRMEKRAGSQAGGGAIIGAIIALT